MERYPFIRVVYLIILFLPLFACVSGNSQQEKGKDRSIPKMSESKEIDSIRSQDFLTPFGQKAVFEFPVNRDNCFFVISKVHPEHLSVYEDRNGDTVLLAVYPVCLAKNKGQKVIKGDNKTPESFPGLPFSISQIQDSRSWTHDFKDGRGPINAYGHWFMRLKTPGFSGIGIHGSTGNRESISAGRGSEGCIRLYDEDIEHLHDYYALVGTPVIILPEGTGPLPFEKRALSKVGATYSIINEEEEPENYSVNTLSQERDSVESAFYVTVKGKRQRMRIGPSEKYPIYEDSLAVAVCPEDGERLICVDQCGNYYRVLFGMKLLYLNKKSCVLD